MFMDATEMKDEVIPTVQNDTWYQGLNLEETKNILRANVVTVARSVIAIGYYLKHIRDNELFVQDGYATLPEFAREEFGLSKSTISRYMAINDRFSRGGNSPIADERYQGFGKSQLQEMLYLTDEQLVQVEPTMQVMDIREMGKQLEGGQLPGQMMITDFPQYLPEGYGLEGTDETVLLEMSIDDLLGGSMPEEVSAPALVSTTPASFTMTVGQLMGEIPEAIAISQQADPEDFPCDTIEDFPCETTDDILLKRIAELEAEREKHRWIPAKERLPEAPGVYICFVRRNDPPVHDAQWEHRRDIIDCGDHYFETCTRWFSEVLGDRAIWSGYCEEVLAWMRLPEPYSPETVENNMQTECPYLETDEFGDTICHNEDECPQDYVADCTVEPEGDCPGLCTECDHQWDCENSDRMDGFF